MCLAYHEWEQEEDLFQSKDYGAFPRYPSKPDYRKVVVGPSYYFSG